MARALIFDFDGVVADSEVLANTVLAEMVSELGVPTTVEDSYRLYLGHRFDEVMATVQSVVGRPVPKQFGMDFRVRVLERFRRELRPVAGVSKYIEAFPELLRCIASSSSPDRLAASLAVLEFQVLFGTNVFSSTLVERGKPHPDIFLFAAKQLNVSASDCIVIEDSPLGVQAGRAAGMTVIGLLAASHIRGDHHAQLSTAGAHFIARTFKEAEVVTRAILAGIT